MVTLNVAVPLVMLALILLEIGLLRRYSLLHPMAVEARCWFCDRPTMRVSDLPYDGIPSCCRSHDER